MKKVLNPLKNERGMLTVDFLFALVMILGFTGLLFVLTFTLSIASLTQYITFAAARNYTVAHLTPELQQERAQAKYHELVSNPVFQPLYKNGWYSIDNDAFVGDVTTVITDYKAAAEDKNQFIGVGTNFTAHVLDFRIPFFGSTVPDGDGKGDGFKTWIGSYLGRDPAASECLEFNSKRWDAIKNLPVSTGAAYASGTSDAKPFSISDDGC